MKLKIKSSFIAACVLPFFLLNVPIGVSLAQCKMDRRHLGDLDPYLYTGQLNNTQLAPGESANLTITFFSDQDYRVLACTRKDVTNIEFEVYDMSKKLLYRSKDHGNSKNWDFSVITAQDYTIRIMVPSDVKTTEKICTGLLVGFKNY